jgi:hypothetical protein
VAYASSNMGGNKGSKGEPSGKSGGGNYASKAGSAGVKGEPGSKLGGGGMTTKGNAKKL